MLRKGKIGIVQGLVKVGCEFFMQAEGNADFVAVETGVPGLYIELTPIEGLEYIEKRQISLQEKLIKCIRYLEEVQMHIETISKTLINIREIDIQEPLES